MNLGALLIFMWGAAMFATLFAISTYMRKRALQWMELHRMCLNKNTPGWTEDMFEECRHIVDNKIKAMTFAATFAWICFLGTLAVVQLG